MAVCVEDRYESSEYKSYHVLIRGDKLAAELASFVSTCPSALGACALKPLAHFVPTDYIGSGSTAVVMSGVFLGKRGHSNIVLKTSREPGPLKLERCILAYLLASGVDAATIPQVQKEVQKVLRKDYAQCCTAFPRRLVSFCNLHIKCIQ